MIEVVEVTKSYGAQGNWTQVLKGISLAIDDGDFTVILGASGSGKSTLLNVISGLERPDSGHVLHGSEDIAALSDKELTRFRRANVGFVFQQYYLLPTMTVAKNIEMGADLARGADYRPVVEALGLSEKLRSYPAELSGGEQQRASVARALAKKPKVLFLDEPTGALDEEMGRKLLHYISSLQQQHGFTILMVTHNQNIANMAGTVITMNSGRITDVQVNSVRQSAYQIGW